MKPPFEPFSCILSKFYIKPQLTYAHPRALPVVSYRNSTSNHNGFQHVRIRVQLYLIEILHQTTTAPPQKGNLISCILSKFYIKPQLSSTQTRRTECCILSKFYIKPQLFRSYCVESVCCILSKFYIKPQLFRFLCTQYERCILSKFYIKPQLCEQKCMNSAVVSYRNSTSNHNFASA